MMESDRRSKRRRQHFYCTQTLFYMISYLIYKTKVFWASLQRGQPDSRGQQDAHQLDPRFRHPLSNTLDLRHIWKKVPMNEDAILQLMRVPDSRPTNCNFGLLVLVSSSDPSLLDQHSAQQMAVQPAPNSSQHAFHKSQIDLASIPSDFLGEPEEAARGQEAV